VVEEHGDFFYGDSTSVPFMGGVRDESLLNNGPEMESETIIQETATSAAAAAESFAAASRGPSLENSAELSSSEGQEATSGSKMPDNQDDSSASSNASGDSVMTGLVYRALQNTKPMMAIDLSALSETMKTLDPSFDHCKFGFAKFREFCEALQPEYVILPDRPSRIFLQRKKSYLLEKNVKGMANNKSEYMALVDRAFDTYNYGRFVEVGDLLKAITALDPLFDYRALGFPTLHDFSRALQPPHKNNLIVIDGRIFVKARHICKMLRDAQVPKEISRGHVTVQPFVASSESADSSCDFPSFEEKGQSV
jgi:hypothetical protein